jgi:NADH:ubiquinone oxidoreductase subunit 2 (subunit N)
VAGYTIVVPLPQGVYERYLGILQTTAVAALTAGKINAFLTTDASRWMAYANNYV